MVEAQTQGFQVRKLRKDWDVFSHLQSELTINVSNSENYAKIYDYLTALSRIAEQGNYKKFWRKFCKIMEAAEDVRPIIDPFLLRLMLVERGHRKQQILRMETTMKNHEWVNGRLLQTNKKWSALKQTQRQWIWDLTRKEHAAYVALHGKLPMKKRKDELMDAIYGHIENRGIWIPYGEFYVPVGRIIDKMNRAKAESAKRPSLSKADLEGFPEDVQSS